MQQDFVHLRVHTEYSLVDGVTRIPTLVEAVAASGMPAVAVTDQSNLFAMVKFYRAAERRGVKPIIGVDILVREDPPAPAATLVLLCQNAAGYRNLAQLVSRSYLEGQERGVPLVDRSWLDPESVDGLIALSGALRGDVGRALQAGNDELARRAQDHWLSLFPNRYYHELQRTGRPDEAGYLERVVQLAADTGVPVVATNDVRFLRASDFEAHEARVCIHDGLTLNDARRPRRYSASQYLRGPEEMAELFSDLPEAIENSVEIACRCNLELRFGESALPAFPVPDGLDEAAFLTREARHGLDGRMAKRAERFAAMPADALEAYSSRLARELDVIAGMGFAGYFLIVADFVRWARENEVPVGPGRGSGAGSLVAYSLGITDVDPLEHDLLFERFLNPERVSMPDFDIDFCMEGRDRVIEYTAQRYGRERVSQIITYGSMAARAVVRDVGRVLGHPYGYVDRIAKLIPMELGVTLEKALESDAELKALYRDEEDVRALIELARSLEGIARNAGKHAGGVVIAPNALTEFTPLYCEEGGTNVVTQFDKDDVESVGLVKFDFLGLRTLTIIDWAVRKINAGRAAGGEELVDLSRIPMDDAATFALLKRCETTAVFQLESRGMKDLIKRLQPDRFDEVVALVALYRPGPLQSGMVEDFIKRKHGEAPIDYPHAELESILAPTYGVILYQEQVMQIAQILAGYSLGGADLLRRAMGKKKPEEMAKQRSVFLDGARIHGVPEQQASRIFDLMEKFAGYGFNKSHSVAYAVLSYQTAWLKAHFPAPFMAAVLSADMDNTDKVVRLIDECARLGLAVAGPDVNESAYAFEAASEQEIRYGLGAIKGVGQSAVESVIAERGEGGAFGDLQDLCQRVDPHRTNRRVLEALLRAGALDALGANRATLMARLPNAVRAAEQEARASAAGQNDLFGLAQPQVARTQPAPDEPTLPDWSDAERLAGERETLGLYLTGHPISEFESELAQIVTGRLAELGGDPPPAHERGRGFGAAKRQVCAAGLVVDMRRRGNRLTLVLDDRSARLEVTVFEEAYRRHRNLLARDAVLVIEGSLRYDDFLNDWRLTAQRILDMDQAREQFARRLDILWRAETGQGDFVAALREALRPFRQGSCTVNVHYRSQGARARLSLGEDWRVRPTSELLRRLTALAGDDSVRLIYPPRVESGHGVP